MVNTLPLAQVLTVLATLSLHIGHTNAAVISERQDPAPSTDVPQAPPNNRRETYHFGGISSVDERAQYVNTTSGLDDYYIQEQALSMATFDGAEDEKWFWFFSKTKIAVEKMGGDMGQGCQVALYFDDVKTRYELGKTANWNITDLNPWGKATAMAPWCYTTDNASAAVNAQFDTEYNMGYKTIRPSTDPAHTGLFVMLSGLTSTGTTDDSTQNWDQAPKTFWSDDATANALFPDGTEAQAFINNITASVNQNYHVVPNPYKYAKNNGDVWAQKKSDILGLLQFDTANSTDVNSQALANGTDNANSTADSVTILTSTIVDGTQTSVVTSTVTGNGTDVNAAMPTGDVPGPAAVVTTYIRDGLTTVITNTNPVYTVTDANSATVVQQTTDAVTSVQTETSAAETTHTVL